MILQNVPEVDAISKEDFKTQYYNRAIPVVIKDLARDWPAFHKWNFEYFKALVGEQRVGLYNNSKSNHYTAVNLADDEKTFKEYVEMIQAGPSEWRIFLFNIFDHAPELLEDIAWPEELMGRLLKKYPMLFVGGAGSITHMHFDIDLSHILHTQFAGRKRVLLFPYQEQYKLYRKPFEVLSLADFSHYHDPVASKLNYEKFPAIRQAEGYEVILDHGDTLYMPTGYWHHMEYLENGFAMSLRAMQRGVWGKVHGIWNLVGMRHVDSWLKHHAPEPWYRWKLEKVFQRAAKYI